MIPTPETLPAGIDGATPETLPAETSATDAAATAMEEEMEEHDDHDGVSRKHGIFLD